nr:DUF6543 domain-containing protein [Pseudomonas sp. B35(2017)]
MTASPAPLLFSQILETPSLWKELGTPLGLSENDLKWLCHVELASHERRSRESSPMFAYRIMLKAKDAPAVPLAGSFALDGTPDDAAAVLYTPLGGVRKFFDLNALTLHLNDYIQTAKEDDPLLALMSLAQRKRLVSGQPVQVSYALINGDIFDDQRTVIEQGPADNAKAMLDELLRLPTLADAIQDMFAERLRTVFPGIDQRLTRVSFPGARWPAPMPLSEAALLVYCHPLEPDAQVRFTHPSQASDATSAKAWEQSLTQIAGMLLPLLFDRMERYWDEPSADGHSRREYFARALAQQAFNDLVLKREARIIDDVQFTDLLRWIRPDTAIGPSRSVALETVRLWENPARPVELAGSLMTSRTEAFLYTPSQGLQVLKDHADLKDTLLAKFKAAGHEDELYGLLSLEERQRFLGFKYPTVSGDVIAGDIFKVLFEAIITKQRQNLEYILQVYRHSDGTVNLEALYDKALDIRSMVDERLMGLDPRGRWSTRPVLTGSLQPSQVLADRAKAEAKKFASVQIPIAREFSRQPLYPAQDQQSYLLDMVPRLAHALFVGLSGEAYLATLTGNLTHQDEEIVKAVFNAEHPNRRTRRAVGGFRPDAYRLTLQYADAMHTVPLANCILLTERGGLDAQHSGHALLWTPALGLEVFDTLDQAKATLSQRLQDSSARLTLLENLAPSADRFHRDFILGPLRLIDGDVRQDRAESSLDRFMEECTYWRELKPKAASLQRALQTLAGSQPHTNLQRAAALARAIALQQTLPAWLGMAAVEDQRLQIELLEQLRILDNEDYLHGLPSLTDQVRETLNRLLARRFPGAGLNPDEIEIAPVLALAGPACSLTEYALRHVDETQGDFTVALRSLESVPAGLNRQAIRQLLLSLEIPATFARQVSEALSTDASGVRKQHFARQVSWQLLQHAHALKLQQYLSAVAFDLVHQVLDMPDAVARSLVQGAHALVRPLELVKTAGAEPVQALGLYLIGPPRAIAGPQVLYAPYHAEQVFREFADEAAVIAAFNVPGTLQDMLVRRLPEAQRSVFASLFKDSAGQTSEMSLAFSPIGGNLLDRLFTDNILLLERLIAGRSLTGALPDWETVKRMFGKTVNLLAMLLPGKIGAIPFLWQSLKDLRHSVEALEHHHWKQALGDIINAAAQLVVLRRLRLKSLFGLQEAAAAEPAPALPDPQWDKIRSTAPARTCLKAFEAPMVSLQNLKHDRVSGTFADPTSVKRYAAVAGKVYRAARAGMGWRLIDDTQEGPALERTKSGQWAIDPNQHTVHYGKAMSRLLDRYASKREVGLKMNVEAQGMEQIRACHPEKARALMQAVYLARHYAFNSLHNLAQFKTLASAPRLDRFLKEFFDLNTIGTDLMEKIANAVKPVCRALVEPTDDLLDTERFVIGSSRHAEENVIAFVVDVDHRNRIHFTEHFFNQELDCYKSGLTQPFDVDCHAQAATLLHELAHQVSGAVDIASLEARRPFSDLIATITHAGKKMHKDQVAFQRKALSRATPREQLFTRWEDEDSAWIDMDQETATKHVAKAVLAATSSRTLDEARTAFLHPTNPVPRIDTILRNADSIAFLICEMGRQLDPVPQRPAGPV